MWAGDAVGTTEWSEPWTGTTSGTTASTQYDMISACSTNSAITYATSGTVKLYYETYASGTAPELYIKSGGTWTVSNIPTGGASELTLTYKSNNTKSSVTCSTTGATISGSSKSYTISPNGAATITLVFSASGNTRIDDVLLTVKTAGSGGSSTPSSAATFTNTTPSINYPATSSYSQAATTATGYDGDVTYSITANTAGATINESTGDVTVTGGGSVTVKASAAATASFSASEATYTLTVNDTRSDSELAFGEASVTKTWGEEFTGQALTNPNSLSVTWSSTDETVASVNALGKVTMLKAGSTDIKATFAGNDTYKTAVVAYTLTVNKAEAGLSFAETAFDIPINDNSFVAPTLVNPHNLDVTYSSNNEAIASVDENTGEIVLETSAAGSATITAYYAGDNCYKGGNAKYTITIYDPTVKGSKYNPYTVAEVIAMAPSSNSTPADGQSDIYVIGYIVGEYRNPTAVNTTVLQSDFTTDANIAIADDPTTTALASSVPVNLTKTADKNSFGNNTNKGKTIGYKVLLKGDVLKYFGMPGLKNIDEISAVSLPATLNAYGYATFASSYALDFSDDSEYSAWQISSANSSTGVITFSQITGTVAAGTGVLLKGTTSSSINIPVTASGSDISSTNKLVGITTATAVDADAYYGLSGNQFKKVGAGTVPAGKALLPATEVSGARELTFVFDEATGIKQVETSKSIIEGIYNLAGQKVQNPTKGLYIMNGKKVIIK